MRCDTIAMIGVTIRLEWYYRTIFGTVEKFGKLHLFLDSIADPSWNSSRKSSKKSFKNLFKNSVLEVFSFTDSSFTDAITQ